MRVLFASTRGAGHFNPLVPFMEACRRGGHEVLVAGSPHLAETVDRAGYPFWPGEAPPEDELGAVWARVPSASRDEAEEIVIGEIFAGLNVRAMLPRMNAACDEWRPDLVLRDTAEYASALAADRHGVRHARIGVSLAALEEPQLAIAGPRLDEGRSGIAERIRSSPYLTLFPASLEDPRASGPPVVHRFSDPTAGPSSRPLPDWWPGNERPLVYVSFGSVTGSLPMAGALYAAALEAVAELPARVLLTVGRDTDLDALGPPPANVRIERWIAQADVFGHTSVVVSHGGSGTTLGALAAGLPLVVIPLFADQPDNARRVAAVGAGLAVEPADDAAAEPIRTSLDPMAVREAVETVLGDPAFARAARALADEMGALPPTDAALAALEGAGAQ